MRGQQPSAWKFVTTGFLLSFGAFLVSCYLIYSWSVEISQSQVASYAVLSVAGISMITWPIFAVKLIGVGVNRALQRRAKSEN